MQAPSVKHSHKHPFSTALSYSFDSPFPCLCCHLSSASFHFCCHMGMSPPLTHPPTATTSSTGKMLFANYLEKAAPSPRIGNGAEVSCGSNIFARLEALWR